MITYSDLEGYDLIRACDISKTLIKDQYENIYIDLVHEGIEDFISIDFFNEKKPLTIEDEIQIAIDDFCGIGSYDHDEPESEDE